MEWETARIGSRTISEMFTRCVMGWGIYRPAVALVHQTLLSVFLHRHLLPIKKLVDSRTLVAIDHVIASIVPSVPPSLPLTDPVDNGGQIVARLLFARGVLGEASSRLDAVEW